MDFEARGVSMGSIELFSIYFEAIMVVFDN